MLNKHKTPNINNHISLNLFYKIPNNINLNSLNLPSSLSLISYLSYKHLCYKDNDSFNLPSTVLKHHFGYLYRKALDELRFNSYIFRETINKSNGHYFDPFKGIVASYGLSKTGIMNLKRSNFRFIPLNLQYKHKPSKKGKYHLNFKSNNPKVLKLLKSYEGISIKPEWIEYFQNNDYHPADHYKYPNEPVSQHGLFLHSAEIVESVLSKRISISAESDSGRIFHPLIRITRSLRKYFRKYGEPLVNIDATSFHPFLIGSCIKDKDERNRYIEIVHKGFYELFMDSEYNRDKVKVSLQKYLGGGSRDIKAKQIASWYNEHFPDVSLHKKELNKKNITFQLYLQQMESSIFVDDVFFKADFFCFSMHDGLAVLREDVDKSKALINRAMEDRLGYQIPLK